MDRGTIYPGQELLASKLNDTGTKAMIAIGHLAESILRKAEASWSAKAAGFDLAPTVPASLQVTVGTGSVYDKEAIDATDLGVPGTANPNSIVKQGILEAPETLTITPPATAGYSQVYLIQVAYQTVDGDNILLPYVDVDHPDVPFPGPGGSGITQPTTRKGVANVTLKSGIAAPTGSQVAPTPDAGYVGLWLITVANGQTAITGSDWVAYSPSSRVSDYMSLIDSFDIVGTGGWVKFKAEAGGWMIQWGQATVAASYATSGGMYVAYPNSNWTGAQHISVNPQGAMNSTQGFWPSGCGAGGTQFGFDAHLDSLHPGTASIMDQAVPFTWFAIGR